MKMRIRSKGLIGEWVKFKDLNEFWKALNIAKTYYCVVVIEK